MFLNDTPGSGPMTPCVMQQDEVLLIVADEDSALLSRYQEKLFISGTVESDVFGGLDRMAILAEQAGDSRRDIVVQIHPSHGSYAMLAARRLSMASR